MQKKIQLLNANNFKEHIACTEMAEVKKGWKMKYGVTLNSTAMDILAGVNGHITSTELKQR